MTKEKKASRRPRPHIRDWVPPDELIAKVRTDARAITQDPDSVEDVLQTVFVKLLMLPPHRWSAITRKEAYFFVCARNVSRTILQRRLTQDSKNRRFMTSQLHIEGPLLGLSDLTHATEDLIRLLEPLGPQCTEVFVRVRLFGRPAASVALVMNLPLRKIHAHLDKADLYLMELLVDDRKSPAIKSRLVRFFKLGG